MGAFVRIIPTDDLGGVPMSLLTFVRKIPDEGIQVANVLKAINRLLERTYPDCTCCLLRAGDFGLTSQWVTVELEITRESLGCLDWYTKQAIDRGLSLADWKARQSSVLETDLADSLRLLGLPSATGNP
jgi:hypothetical protein